MELYSSMDQNERFMDSAEGSSGGRRGDCVQEHLQGTGEKHFDHSDDESGPEQQDVRQHVAQEVSREGSSGIVIHSLEELRVAMKVGNLSKVESIEVYNKDIGSGNLTFAEVLASGEMYALKSLQIQWSRLEDNRSEAICNALASQRFACLTFINFGGNNIGTEAVKALGRAIGSGNLEMLEILDLWRCSINDDDMATLAKAFQDGETSLLPNLRELDLSYNNFRGAGFQSLSEALISGRLDTLEKLWVWSPSNSSKESANALLTAFALNHCLITDVFFEWYRFPDLGRRYHQLRERNKKNKEILAGLLDCPMVPAAFGKVFLCGSPKVGKTTLSHTLQRGFWKALVTWQMRPHVEKCTRGIEVSQFSSKGTKQITLLVWDMAGQQDYHLVHNAFFPDLSFSEGKATTFVIVCNSEDLDEAEQQLDYWLKYIASSCQKTTPRLWHVFVVLNNFGGHIKVHGYAQRWVRVLEYQRDKFNGFLNVHTDSFVLDVRRRREVVGFKTCLLEHSRSLLNDEKVHEICQTIQLNLLDWSERKEFPVLDWEEYMQKVRVSSLPWPENIIEAATKYLNEAGVLIYIDKKFPDQWDIPYQRLVVLDVNWFCKEVVGEIFLSDDMVSHRQHPFLFRKRVASTTGSISISDFKKFFKSEWIDKDFEHLITILLWLGLCYKGNEENVFIPSLIDINGKPGGPWQYQREDDEGPSEDDKGPSEDDKGPSEDDEEQWVMGFSIEHKERGMTLASMSLWHRFQVILAQTRKFNGEVPDNDFAACKYFMTFNFDYMHVLIQVDAAENIPTFHEISVFVKPMYGKKDKLDAHERKQRQVDLAHHLVEILLGLWDDICGGVEYVRKVVWPWPSSQSRLGRPGNRVDRNKEVAEIERSVQMHGIGRKMQWNVGKDSEITEDQLLSTNEKRNVIKSMESDVSILRERMREAVNLRIYPLQLIEESSVTSSVPAEGIQMATCSRGESSEFREVRREFFKKLNEIEERATCPTGESSEVKELRTDVFKKLNEIENRLQEGFTKVMREKKKVFQKLQETQRFLEEDKDRSCPKLIYLGDKDSGAWATLKQALSPAVHVRLNFACEANYKNYRPHFVTGQKGLDVSALRPSLKKIVPWLKVSLTILSITAKVGANFAAPGVGLIVPNFQEWQQASSLLEGIEWATGLPKVELDKLMVQGMGLDPNEAQWNPRDIYGKSREAITNLIGNLSPEDYQVKLGLRKVYLKYRDGSLHGVVWICNKCLRNFRELKLVSEG